MNYAAYYASREKVMTGRGDCRFLRNYEEGGGGGTENGIRSRHMIVNLEGWY